MKLFFTIICAILLISPVSGLAQNIGQTKPQTKEPVFELVVLGDRGGIKDGNLSAFLLRAVRDKHYVALDAGTLINGIEVALKNHALLASLFMKIKTGARQASFYTNMSKATYSVMPISIMLQAY